MRNGMSFKSHLYCNRKECGPWSRARSGFVEAVFWGGVGGDRFYPVGTSAPALSLAVRVRMVSLSAPRVALGDYLFSPLPSPSPLQPVTF